MKKQRRIQGVAKSILACICSITVLFAYSVPAVAADDIEKVKVGATVTEELTDEDSVTYSVTVTRNTRVKLTASAESVYSLDDEEEYEETDSNEEDYFLDDSETVAIEAVEEVAPDSDDAGDEFGDDEEDTEADEDDIEYDDSDYVEDSITIGVKKGSKAALSKWVVVDGETASKYLALTAGTYKITITASADEGIKYSLSLKDATKYATKISVPKKKTLSKGKSCTLKVTATGGALNNLTFTSSNKKIAKVSAKGKVTAVKAGTCKITVKMKGLKKKAVCKIKVK